MFKLPEYTEALVASPRKLIIYSAPKAGKTKALSMLKNCCILDFEEGSDFVSGIKYKIKNADELKSFFDGLDEANKKEGKFVFKYLALDTLTSMEEIAWEIALSIYKNSALGKSFSGDIYKFKNLPNGAAYGYLREAMDKIINRASSLCEFLILTAHFKQTAIQRSNNEGEIMASDIAVTGKSKLILSSQVDAIGKMFRKDNKTFITFKNTEDDIATGCRSEHLINKSFPLVEYDADQKVFTSHWDEIFIN